MKIGIIGFGSIGKRHYENLLRHTKDIVVLSKRRDVDLPNFAASWADFKKMGPYDAIFITNETSEHITTINKCLTLKPRAIFIEKPISHNSRGLESAAKKAKNSGINLWVGYCMQFYKPFMKIKNILKNGKLGKIYYMRVSVGQDLRGWRPGRDYSKIYSAKREKGGGAMLDLVHDINYPAWLLDDILVPKRALVRKISDLKINTEDLAENIFIAKKSGAVVSVHQDYIRIPGKRSLEIIGSKSSLMWDSSDTEDRNKMYQREIKFFLNKIKSGGSFSNVNEAIRDVQNVEYLKKYGK